MNILDNPIIKWALGFLNATPYGKTIQDIEVDAGPGGVTIDHIVTTIDDGIDLAENAEPGKWKPLFEDLKTAVALAVKVEGDFVVALAAPKA